jgi:hypothetical protein
MKPPSVVRYARPTDVDNDVVNGSAFHRKPNEDGVSVNRRWVFSKDDARDISCIRTVLTSWMTIKKNGRLAEIGCDDIAEVGLQLAHALGVVDEPLHGKPFNPSSDVGATSTTPFENPAHALIDGLPFPGADAGDVRAVLAGDLLAARIFAVHPATN